MKNKTFITLLCAVLTLFSLACGFSKIFPSNSAKNELSASTADTPAATADFAVPANSDKPQKLSLHQGETAFLSVSKEKEFLVKGWTSSNSRIVSVDSAGRVCAELTGSACVTALFADKTSELFEITVIEAKEKSDNRFSTAVTANEDILEKNLNSFNDESTDKNPYSIKVNRAQNCVTVYTYDENGEYTLPVRAMVCSTGKDNSTITGKYNIYFKGEWHLLYQGVYGYYVSGISGDYLFHSVPYYEVSPDELEVEEFNKLGTQASLGCVRLAISDAKWIYENCPEGTEVEIYDSDDPGPLGKPETIKITDLKCGWDPTDDNVFNPYYDKTPVISGAVDRTLKLGEIYDPLYGITAVDTCNNDITDKIVTEGRINTSKKGCYKMTYSVTDVLNRSTSIDVLITVE